MAWLKRNIVLVLAGVVALGLLGFAGFFLYTRIQRDSEVTQLLNDQTTELERLVNLKPHPGNEKVNNIEAAKKQDEQLKGYLAKAKERFVPMEYPKGLDSGQLKLMLGTTIDELKRGAQRAGVKLPEQFSFAFSSQKQQMAFEQKVIDPLSKAIVDVRMVSEILFEAKVLQLDSIRRPVLATDTPGGGASGQSEYWGRKPQTNDLALVIPYEFVFRCFTPELAVVLQGLARSPHCLIAKHLVVDPGTTALESETPEEGSGTPAIPGFPGMTQGQLMMLMRYGRMPGGYGAYGIGPQAQSSEQTPVLPIQRGPTTLVEEKPFRVVMRVDIVRLKEPEDKEKARKPKRQDASADAQPPADAGNQ